MIYIRFWFQLLSRPHNKKKKQIEKRNWKQDYPKYGRLRTMLRCKSHKMFSRNKNPEHTSQNSIINHMHILNKICVLMLDAERFVRQQRLSVPVAWTKENKKAIHVSYWSYLLYLALIRCCNKRMLWWILCCTSRNNVLLLRCARERCEFSQNYI